MLVDGGERKSKYQAVKVSPGDSLGVRCALDSAKYHWILVLDSTGYLTRLNLDVLFIFQLHSSLMWTTVSAAAGLSLSVLYCFIDWK